MGSEERERRRPSRGVAALFPVALCYYEILFRLFTGAGLFRAEVLLALLFSCAYGGFGYLLCTLCAGRRANRRIAAALLFLSALPYLVEAFVYRAFKVYYDLNTVFGGANDVMGDFMGDTLRLIFSPWGLLMIALYLVPFAAVLAWRGSRSFSRITARQRLMTAARMTAFYLICILCIHAFPAYSQAYGEQYNFQTAVTDFGFLTGVRLDVKQMMSGGASFTIEQPQPRMSADGGEDQEVQEVQEQAAEGTPAPEQTVDYGFNQLDLVLQDTTGSASKDVQNLDAYVSSLSPTKKNQYTGIFQGKNLIFLSAEAFTAEVIDPELTPTLYRLATKGIQFTDYYQPSSAGTTGGEFENIFGLLPMEGGSSFPELSSHVININMGTQLNNLGYYGKAFHNNTYTYYDRDETHNRLGYSDGYMGLGNGMEQYVTQQWPESDYEMISGTLPTYIDRQPFNIYYMTVSGHSGYTVQGNSMTRKHWDQVADLPYSDPVKGYIAANLDLEDAMAYLVQELEARGIADDTVICMGADHFPYGLDDGGSLGNMPYLSELYGYEVEDAFQKDHNRLILWCGSLEDQDPIVVDEPTSSLDILPTLCNLFGVQYDSRLLPGRDVFSDAPALVFNVRYDWKTEYGTYFGATNEFIPKDETVTLPDGYVDDMTTVVRNKVNFCRAVLNTDYYTVLFWGRR